MCNCVTPQFLSPRVLEAERLFSLLSRRLADTKASVNRQEEFCSATGIRLDEKYSGIERDIEAIKDVVCKSKSTLERCHTKEFH